MTRRAATVARAVVVAWLLTGCATAPATPTPSPGPSSPGPSSAPPVASATPQPTPEPTAQPTGARLSITGSGTIPSASPFGCLASLLVDPGTGVVDRIATWDDARFAMDVQGTGTSCKVSGPAIGGPVTLAPGRYRLTGVASIVSDEASPGFSQPPILGSTARCQADLAVLATTTEIHVEIAFGDGPCQIDVTSR